MRLWEIDCVLARMDSKARHAIEADVDRFVHLGIKCDVALLLRMNGIESLADLISAAQADQLVAVDGLAPEDVLALERLLIARGFLAAAPVHHFLVNLKLSARALNLLYRNQVLTLEQLLAKSRDDLWHFHGLGPKTLAEIEACKENPEFVSEAGWSAAAELFTTSPAQPPVAPLPCLFTTTSDLAAQLRAELETGRLHPQAYVKGWSIADWLQAAERLDRKLDCASEAEWSFDALNCALAYRSVAEELSMLFAVVSARNLRLFARRFGPQPHTLVELACEIGRSRGRVQEITSSIARRVIGRLPAIGTLRIQSALNIAADLGDDITFDGWSQQIARSGLLGEWDERLAGYALPEGVTVLELLIAISNPARRKNCGCVYMAPPNLRLVLGYRRVSARVVRTVRELPPTTLLALRRQARSGGAVSAASAAESMGLGIDEARSALQLLNFCLVADDWYMLNLSNIGEPCPLSWTISRQVMRMLRFCGPLPIQEIARGLQQHIARRHYVAAPPHVLAHVLRALGFQVTDGLVSWPSENLAKLSRGEKVILQTIERLGSVVSAHELSQAFVNAGLSRNSLTMTFNQSLLFVKVGSGLYALRGKPITPGDIERAIARKAVRTAASSRIFTSP